MFSTIPTKSISKKAKKILLEIQKEFTKKNFLYKKLV
jgi:hypothetical protein